tara:strand:- start:84 stop:194 length:111 start_codon:yes stop_codon:yes gene_type:complete
MISLFLLVLEHEEYDDAHEGTQLGPIEEYLIDREID